MQTKHVNEMDNVHMMNEVIKYLINVNEKKKD